MLGGDARETRTGDGWTVETRCTEYRSKLIIRRRVVPRIPPHHTASTHEICTRTQASVYKPPADVLYSMMALPAKWNELHELNVGKKK